jgi:TRAP-type mannitol/chloroaromatic compound transport system substrate-binding protein
VVYVSVAADDLQSAIGFSDSQTATTSSTASTVIATYATTTYNAAKIVVVADNGTDRTVSELLVTWKGATAYATEYAVVNTGTASLASYDVDVSGGNFRIVVTAASSTSTNYTVKAIVL